MKDEDLIKARQVWEALFIAEPTYTLNWQSWADDTMLTCEIPPIWIIDLSLAKERGLALKAVQNSIGIDIKKLKVPLDSDSLILGIIYSFWSKSTDELNNLWHRFNEVTDMAEFLEKGEYSRSLDMSPITKENFLEKTEFLFEPLARHANAVIANYIGEKYIGT
jgi:hypothetical protein